MIWLLLSFVLIFSGCQQKASARQYTEVVQEVAATPVSTSQEKMDASDPHAGLDMSSMVLPQNENSNTKSLYSWEVPNGWKQESGQGMRLVTFHLISDENAIDCSIVSLGGMAGGLEANLTRWMGQIGLKGSPDDLSRLIKSAPSVKIKGEQDTKIFDFTIIQSNAKLTDKTMISAMVSINGATVFVKIAGSIESVKKNKENFIHLVESIKPQTTLDNKIVESIPSKKPTSADPHAGLDMSSMGAATSKGMGSSSQSMVTWVAPNGWKEEVAKHMRLATFRLSNNPQAIDCSIIALTGEAGGKESNLNRWMGQIGLKPSQDNLNKLINSVSIIKTKGSLKVELYDFTYLQINASLSDKSMLSAMIPVDNITVFVKMTGSVESVKQNKNGFLKLIESISRK